MKNAIFSVAAILLFVILATPALAGVAEEFMSLSREYELNILASLHDSLDQGLTLNAREKALTDRLLASEDELSKVVAQADRLELGLLTRLISRIQFEVIQEGRTSLQPYLSSLRSTLQSQTIDDRVKKKIANIYGREVDLLDGEWKTAPDGRRYWVSNEYPDIILSSADYRRYLATAVTVED
ncbi:MAG: hypothetical protein OZSIB_2359 [Candidatus Ozemobacter sibiricus]|uniref:Uncharacterized protein n=1 Tax=Candidatus Ozemobacter sibiricus TaxID=2268124 RepID=A0A367ZUE1_9BACT|nr:MAG: hypothetical protein OZSIB_2359 [Candidatus Ozemobacter sibiricus]